MKNRKNSISNKLLFALSTVGDEKKEYIASILSCALPALGFCEEKCCIEIVWPWLELFYFTRFHNIELEFKDLIKLSW
jgi:hypothetical protein